MNLEADLMMIVKFLGFIKLMKFINAFEYIGHEIFITSDVSNKNVKILRNFKIYVSKFIITNLSNSSNFNL